MEATENKVSRQEFEAAFLQEHGGLDMSFDESSNTYHQKEVQTAWWAWQDRQQQLDALEESKRDYVCDCDFLDTVDEVDDNTKQLIEEGIKTGIEGHLTGLIDRVNRFGIEELLDEIDRMGFKLGKSINRKELLNSISST